MLVPAKNVWVVCKNEVHIVMQTVSILSVILLSEVRERNANRNFLDNIVQLGRNHMNASKLCVVRHTINNFTL